MVNHVFHGDFNGTVQSHDDHPQRVSHQHQVDLRLVGQQTEGVIIGGDHHQLAALSFGLLDVQYCYFFTHLFSSLPINFRFRMSGFMLQRTAVRRQKTDDKKWKMERFI